MKKRKKKLYYQDNKKHTKNNFKNQKNNQIKNPAPLFLFLGKSLLFLYWWVIYAGYT